jgi:hypothetical protein
MYMIGRAKIFHEEGNEDICQNSTKRVRNKDVKWYDEAPTFSFPNLGQEGGTIFVKKLNINWVGLVLCKF